MYLYSGKRTVKKGIVEILAKEFPLTIKQVKEHIASNYGLKSSYQAVHKEIWNLVNEEIVVVEDGLFSLNPGWVRNNAIAFKEIERDYCGPHQSPRLILLKARRNPLLLEFDSLRKLDEYMIEILKKTNDFAKSFPVIMFTKHRRWPLLYPKQERDMLSNVKFISSSMGTTPLDRLASRTESGFGAQTRTTDIHSETWEFIVLGDLVFQVYIDKNVAELLDRTFETCRDFGSFMINDLLELSISDVKSSILVQHNPSLAEKIRANFVEDKEKITLNDF